MHVIHRNAGHGIRCRNECLRNTPIRRRLKLYATPFTLPNTDIREAPTARVGADQIDTCATSQNWLVKDKPEGRYSAGARATKVTAYAAACTKASTPRDASSA